MDEAYRIRFRFSQGEYEVVSRRRVAMRVPRSQPIERGREPGVGQFYEVQDEKGEAVYRRHLGRELDRVEVPTGDPDRPLAQVARPDREEVFSLLVPVVPGGRRMVIAERGRRPDQAADQKQKGSAPERRDLIAVDFDDDRQGDDDGEEAR